MIEPFLRRVGGKNWSMKHIGIYQPCVKNNHFKPILGGSSIFIYLRSKGAIKEKSYLSNTNYERSAYKVLKSKPGELFQLLRIRNTTEKEYYNIGKATYTSGLEIAFRYLFLNKTSFIDLYRVNKRGEYDVPFGHQKINKFYDFEQLILILKSLKKLFFGNVF